MHFQDWQVWLGLAVVLAGLELFSLDLVLLMLAGGALVGMVVGLAGDVVWLQVLAAAASSLAALGLLRPNMVARLHQGPDLVLGHQALVGHTGTVLERVTPDGGRVRIGGDVWTARPYDEQSVIEPGARVDVLQIQGVTALVHEVPRLDP